MKYIISDIHGCYKEYKALLEKLHLTREDHLYILGDTVDRGPAPIKVVQDLIRRENVTYILGNHDFLFWYFFSKKGLNLGEKNLAECDPDDLADFRSWLEDGGITTAKQYFQLPAGEKAEICKFFQKANVYETIQNKERTYILVHAGIAGFEENIPLEQYDFMDFIYTRADYDKRYFQDPNTFLVTGHTPTPCIRKDSFAEIYTENGHIAIDCGCVYGGKLAAYCVETDTAIYVNGKR